ncbi:hypothetical protein [Sphingopyxis sp.]|uniref:hypothetical protein n=1 Tax=Sphingopyxis sp. TaxID=1908224 RepID=UPI002D766974|nr:hypothetical protein [Sphingopyxis sp.]HET6526819.1 hypothetical protein [Sphingopyxis sp.]
MPDLPANPLKAIDGEWYGVDRKDQAVRGKRHGDDRGKRHGRSLFKKIAAPAGTVIARITAVESAGSKSARFVGRCLELIDTSRSDTIACPGRAFVQSAADGGKPGLKINFWTAAVLRKDNIPEYQWQYRK